MMFTRQKLAVCLSMLGGIGGLSATAGVDLPREPALSADGSVIAFTWAGDIWAVSASGGVASRLTSHPADDGRSAFSPDGTSLVFESNRDGARNFYMIELTGEPPALIAGESHRVTEWDRTQSLSAFTGEGLLFSGRVEPSIYRHARMYRAPLDGGPVERLTDAFGFDPTPTADGGVLFTRGRFLESRPAYRGPGSTDVYRMDAEGAFTRLTSDAGSDHAAHELPDGSVVFVSTRDGQNNVYRLGAGATDADAGALTQLTSFEPGAEVSIGHGVRDFTVSADGSTAAFVVWDTLYTLDLEVTGAAPSAVTIVASSDDDVPDRTVINVSTDASEIAWHPSDKAVAIVARGEIWLRSTEDDQPTRRITTTAARERDIAWSPDGSTLYFSSDDEVSLGSIHGVTVSLSRDDLAGAKDETEEEAAPDEPADETPAPSTEPDDPESAQQANGIDEPVDTPEEHSSTDSPDTEPEATDEGASDEEEKPEPIDYGSRWADALLFEIEPVLTGDTWDYDPMPSPDGTSMLFVRGRGDLMLLDLASGDVRTVFEGWNVPDVQWLTDSRHIVFARQDLDFNADVWLLDIAEGGAEAAINLTRHPDIDMAPRISADGKVLTFLSDRAGENWNFGVYRVYLDASLEDMTEYELAAHFEEAAKAAKKRKPLEPSDEDGEDAEPLTFDADDAWLRIRRVTNMEADGALAITPGGDRIAFTSSDGEPALYSVKYDGSDRKTVQSGSVSGVTPSLSGGAFAFLQRGQARSATPTGGDKKTYGIAASVRISRQQEQRQKFLEGARTFGATFYNTKGLDWDALTARYLSLAERTRTSAEFNAVFNLLLGEVNGSHTGIWGGGGFSTSGPGTGYLGIDVEPDVNGFRVTRVLETGPSAKGPSGLLVGDVVTAINGTAIARGDHMHDFNAAMTDTSGDETLLTLEREGEQAFVLVEPHSYTTENNLRYADEIEHRRAEVERLSDGRLGYLHIRGMNMPSVRDFERDLYAAAKGREGLVIDVRDNGGGFTTDILLASLTAPRHAYTIPRGADPAEVQPDDYPRDRRLIYGWTRPINVLINQNSFSNAEIFAHSIKTAGRGRLIGTKTFGGVISTGSFRLIDGTTIRRPFRGWYLPDGRDMDIHGADPDVPVAQTPEDEAAGRDRQLEAAVRDLLDQIDSGKDPRAVRP